MRTPPRISEEVLAEAVAQYMREVEGIQRIERMLMRKAITKTYQEEGLPVPEGEAMEAQIDELETLLDAGHHDQEQVRRLIAEMNPLIDTDQQGLIDWKRVCERVSQPRTASGTIRSMRKGARWSKN